MPTNIHLNRQTKSNTSGMTKVKTVAFFSKMDKRMAIFRIKQPSESGHTSNH